MMDTKHPEYVCEHGENKWNVGKFYKCVETKFLKYMLIYNIKKKYVNK